MHDPDGQLLLVQRANEPGAGRWSLPGGRVEAGEAEQDAVVREVAEETGLQVRPARLVGRVRRGPYLIADYACDLLGGVPRAGDDASDVRWADAGAYAALPLVDGLTDALTGWGVLPA